MSEKYFQREINKKWYVKYDEMQFPAVQKGWVLSPGSWEMFDPFIILAEDWFKKGTFSDHPHRGFQTITYVIDGRLEHTDNTGGHGILESGDVQYMNAGRGARHAEEAVDDDIAHTLQLWLNLPSELKTTEASYQDVYSEDCPLVPFEGGQLKVYAGKLYGVTGPLNSHVPFCLSELSLSQGTSFTLRLPENYNSFVYVLSGNLDFTKEKVNLLKTGVAHLTFNEEGSDENDSELVIKANERSKILIYSGKPIREEMVAHGPFVMNTMEEVHVAVSDFHSGKFGPSSQS